MKTLKSFVLILISMAMQPALASSFSVSSWEDELQSTLESEKKDLTKILAFAKIEKKYLTRANSSERKNITQARTLFTSNKMPAALEKYNLIEKGSDYWLESVEEKGWAYHRQDDYEKALAQTKTLLAEPLIQVVGSEPFFLQSLSQLKICDYQGVLATHQLFKDSQRARIESIEKLAQSGQSSAVLKVIEKANSFPLTFVQIGTEAKELPRLFYKDLEIQKNLLRIILSSKGMAHIQTQIADSDISAKDKMNLTKNLELLKKVNTATTARLQNRLKALAQIEDKQNQLMLQKLGLIEIETIQRMHTDQAFDPKKYSQGQFTQATVDELVFPDDGQPWIDELDKYQVKANRCPRNVRRKM